MQEKKFKSDELAAQAYGLDYTYDNSGEYEPETPELTCKRVKAMNDMVVQWIAQNGRIPTINPYASLAERRLGHWLHALQFYAHITVDPKSENRDEVESNGLVHSKCQFAIVNGKFPPSEQEDSE